MASEKNMRMEKVGKGPQEMQEEIAQMTKMGTKGKGITDDPGLQRNPTSWKDVIDPFIVPNLNNPCEQESFRKKIRLDGQTMSTCSKGAVS